MVVSVYRVTFWLSAVLVLAISGLGALQGLRTTGSLPALPQVGTAVSAKNFHQSTDPQEQVEQMRAHTAIEPRNSGAWLYRCKAHLDVDDLVSAIVACKRAFALGDRSGQSNLLLARIYVRANRPKFARAQAKLAVQLGQPLPRDLRGLVEQGDPS
jgi:cytochrome c-type biogenesis protein CcmH/NrfG